ncbi:DUF4238 domain-containing protein [Stutzerimonas chloritidismutans]
MAAHKGQHIIPACYLRGFIAAEAPIEHRGSKNYELGVYVNNKIVSQKWKMRGVNHEVFKKSWFYNISEPGNELHVEKSLSGIEGRYANSLKEIKKYSFLSEELKRDISCFVATMLIRTESFQANFQGAINTVVGWHKELSSDIVHHNEYAYGHENISRKLVVENTAQGILSKIGLSILVNRTSMPFITCDTPVLRRDTHSDEIAYLAGQGAHCKTEFTPNQIFPFFYMPLSAEMAVVSCGLIDHVPDENQYIECLDVDAIFKLNIMLASQSQKYIVSDRSTPFGNIEKNVSKRLQDSKPQQGVYANLYTCKNRYYFKVKDMTEIVDGIRLKISDLKTYRGIISDHDLSSIDIYVDGKPRRGMRQIELGNVNEDILEMEFVSKIKLGII